MPRSDPDVKIEAVPVFVRNQRGPSPYYRSDHFEFAKLGVPAFYSDSGVDYSDKPEGYGERKSKEYTANVYHQPSDEVKPDWDLAGAVEDARLLFEMGARIAADDRWPEWKDGAEFKAVREAMLR